jgi:LacI family transcriptional regulator
VAQSTVSAALHGRGRVGDRSRKRILRIAEELGYQPRVAAQLLRANQTGQLGIIVAATKGVEALAGEIQRSVVGQFVAACLDQNVRFMIDFHHHDQDHDHPLSVPQHVAGRLVDGVLLVGDVGEPLRALIASMKSFPWVSIAEPAEYCVLTSADRAVADAVRMLHGLGHRRIAFLGGPERYAQQRLGLQGFRAAAAECAIASETKTLGGDPTEVVAAGVAWARELLRRPVRPTAFICHAEYFARGVIHAATEAGLRVPQDLSVVSYGIRFDAQRRYPHLTTIENDYAEMTAQAMQLLRQRMSSESIEQPVRHVMPRLVPGDTVAAAPVE